MNCGMPILTGQTQIANSAQLALIRWQAKNQCRCLSKLPWSFSQSVSKVWQSTFYSSELLPFIMSFVFEAVSRQSAAHIQRHSAPMFRIQTILLQGTPRARVIPHHIFFYTTSSHAAMPDPQPATHWRCCQCRYTWTWNLDPVCHNDNHRRCARCIAFRPAKPRAHATESNGHRHKQSSSQSRHDRT